MSIPVKIQFQEETRRLSVEPNISFEELCSVVSKIEPLFSSHVFKYQDNEGDSVFVTSTLELSEALASAKSKGLTLKLVVVEKPKPSVQIFENPEPVIMKTPKDTQETVANIENAIQGLVDKVVFLAKGAQKGAETVLPKVTQAIGPAFTTAKTFGTEQYTNIKEWKDPVGDFLRVVSQKVEEAAYGSSVLHQAWCDNCKSQIQGIRYKCGNCADYDLCQYCEIKQIHNPEHVFLKINTPISYAQSQVLLPNLYQKPLASPKAEAAVQAPVPAPVSIKQATAITEEEIVPLDAVFVADETVKDGTVFSPETSFVKIWVMQNSGSQKWVEGTKLVLVSGNPFGSKGEIPVRAAEVGEKIDIFAEMKAPSTPGRFSSHWRLSTPDGHKFGHRIWVEIIVDEKAPKPQVPQVAVEAPKPVVEVPKTNPAPVSDLEKKYASTMAALAELGFSNKEKNLALAQKYNGDIVQIVTSYLDN